MSQTRTQTITLDELKRWWKNRSLTADAPIWAAIVCVTAALVVLFVPSGAAVVAPIVVGIGAVAAAVSFAFTAAPDDANPRPQWRPVAATVLGAAALAALLWWVGEELVLWVPQVAASGVAPEVYRLALAGVGAAGAGLWWWGLREKAEPRLTWKQLEPVLRAALEARALHARVVSLHEMPGEDGRFGWLATLDVGSTGAALQAQLKLVASLPDARPPLRNSARRALERLGRQLHARLARWAGSDRFAFETGEAYAELGADGGVDQATLRFRSHVFENLAAMVTLESPWGIANGVETSLPDFAIGKFPVTQALYVAVMGTNPSEFEGDLACPVEQVSWYDAVRFCNALSALAGREPAYVVGEGERPAVDAVRAADGFRLPTEAEWEVACRAGTESEFYWGDEESLADKYAWFGGNSGRTTHAVGEKLPNAWGLHDMAGNVWEWTNSAFDAPGEAGADGVGPLDPGVRDSPGRVVRGGSWDSEPWLLRSAIRDGDGPEFRVDILGFRCASSPPRAWPLRR